MGRRGRRESPSLHRRGLGGRAEVPLDAEERCLVRAEPHLLLDIAMSQFALGTYAADTTPSLGAKEPPRFR